MDDRERRIRLRCRDDFPHYAARALKIRTKAGGLEPFVLNRAQRYMHEQAEEQRSTIGKVRVNLLKGRQQGASTYITGRGYWISTHRKGYRVFILTHEMAATDNLFEMVSRFHEHMNPVLKPSTSAANAKELRFDLLDSGYQISTAGTKGTGRSSTVQFFHGSEVAFWPNAHTHGAGVLQAVPDQPGTEIWRESTSDGPANYFHEQWMMAQGGQTDFRNVFVPWWWDDGYTREGPITLDDAEREYQEAYGTTDSNMLWRRQKIANDFGGDASQFAREYPATPDEAFAHASDEAFISPLLVTTARRARCEPVGPRLGGVDVARFGDDSTAFATRQGRVVHSIEKHARRDTMEVTGLVKRKLDSKEWDLAFIDVVGVGSGVVDRLREMGYASRIVAVNGGESALDDSRYVNRRAEMYGELREWLKDQPASLPDDDELQTDLCSVRYKFTSKSQYQLEKKDEQKKRIGRSPDIGDAVALTFAQPVARVEFGDLLPQAVNGATSWMA